MSVAVLAIGLFSLGLYGVLTRRELIGVLASIEIMLGSAILLLVGLASAGAVGRPAGTVEAAGVIIIVFAAAEASVGLALVIAAARRFGTTRVDDIAEVWD